MIRPIYFVIELVIKWVSPIVPSNLLTFDLRHKNKNNLWKLRWEDSGGRAK